ncbi:hypothetical protein [Trichocoleus sp. FACHB-262]|uniref:hypothetical protein n=1 Tax=Trichocoleus sp. FACHB-262 TaxID=2692869 RepID=UPI001683F854|nr:hypothetical protein [Trichocoleus sp. FACHB-262]MBD2121135.1 hypothetical protein [Trichocoleus sp. FACHB-262]
MQLAVNFLPSQLGKNIVSSSKRHCQIRFFYDWGCDSPFWCGNDAAHDRFGVGPIEPEELGLSAGLYDGGDRIVHSMGSAMTSTLLFR